MKQRKVLVVDDEKLLVKSTCMALNYHGFEAMGALDGKGGIEAAEQFEPDVILLDIMMPGMDGWEVLKELKNRAKTRDIPVIVFTAREYADGKKMASSFGAVDYIPKPFELDVLVGVMKDHLA